MVSPGPTVRAVRRSATAVELDLHLPRNLDWFHDHFPRLALLPGVVQVDWAIRYGREHLGPSLAGDFRGMKNLKFVNPILPDSDVTLSLEARAPGELSFSYRAGDRTYSLGRIQFGSSA